MSNELRALFLKIAERLRAAADDYERRANTPGRTSEGAK